MATEVFVTLGTRGELYVLSKDNLLSSLTQQEKDLLNELEYGTVNVNDLGYNINDPFIEDMKDRKYISIIERELGD